MEYVLFFVGFVALIRGAEWLVEGSTRLARQFGISDLIAGLTVVAFGTSLPELVVNLFANKESSELAIGNIVGSNISNILLILGTVAIMRPLSVHATTVYREIIFNIGAAAMLAVLVAERFLAEGGFSGLDHIDGIVLMSYFAIFIYYTFGRIPRGKLKKLTRLEGKEKKAKTINLADIFTKIIVGAFGLWLGGQWIVNGAIEISQLFGISDALLGLTVVAIGTSLPELVASIVAVRKGEVDVAVGNAVGSNLFNIFWVLGLSAFISPLAFRDTLVVDILVNLGVACVLFLAMILGPHRHQISKVEGRVFLSLYFMYIVFAVYRG